jgi:beta-barrel assembly-enhancing protease
MSLLSADPAVRPVRRSWLTALALGVVLVTSGSLGDAGLSVARAQSPALPSLGDGTGMTVTAERALGDSIARDIYRDPDYLDDPLLSDYLQSIWQPLLSAARSRGDVDPELSERLAWELMISRARTVNAFALPGGYLGVHLGLLSVTETPQELASVLAHELSHVSQRHIARMISQQDRQAPWLIGAMILGALAAKSSVDAANAAIVGSQAVAAQTQLNFSRDMEREADRVGFAVLTAAGFEGAGFVTMFEKLQQASRLNDDGGFPYLRSHPLTTERMADMKARLPLAPSRPVGPVAHSPAPVTPDQEIHTMMSARARVLAENGPDRLQVWLRNGQDARTGLGDRYAAALAASRLGRHELAERLAAQVASQAGPASQRHAEWLQLEVGLTALQQRAVGAPSPQWLTWRDRALASGTRAGLLLGAQAALASGAARDAAQRLHGWVIERPRDAQAWQTLSRAEMAQGQRLRSVRAEAEARVAHLDWQGALERFRAAQALPAADRNADPVELAIVDARAREMEQRVRELMRKN